MAIRSSLNSLHLNTGITSENEDSQKVTTDIGRLIYGLSQELVSTEQVRSYTTSEKRGDPTPGLRSQRSLHFDELPRSDFVVHGKDSKANDPFLSPSEQNDIRVQDEASKPLSQNTKDTSKGVANDRSPECQPEVASSPRADRLGQEISADNAQAILPPSACVFVAK